MLGHILWLIGVTIAMGSSSVNAWVSAISAIVVIGAAVSGYLAWQRYQRKELVGAAFLASLPIAPVIFTVIVLGVTYL